jgi:uncharacterized protein
MLSQAIRMEQTTHTEALWKTPGEPGRHTLLSIVEYLEKRILESNDDQDFTIAVGTDSQIIGSRFCFVSVISVHKKGKGGTYYFKQELSSPSKHMISNQKMRMFEEVTKSLEIAMAMRELKGIEPQIHIDASPEANTKSFTSKFSEQLKGYVVSSGFQCLLKPDSYAANAIADKHTKKKSNGIR